jgi:dihydroorotase
MPAYARRHAQGFGRALAMPNTVPPIASAPELTAYRDEIIRATQGALAPLMTFKLLPGMTAETASGCAAAGAIAGKYYPRGATTNAADGLADPSEAPAALAAMEEAGLVLSIHAEEPSAPILEREEAFIPVLERILALYPRLKVVVEHISSAALLEFVLSCPGRVAGGVTAHHLLFTLDDLIGEGLNPHLYCKPVLKTSRDRDALRDAVFRGEPRVFFGSDSAPHPRSAKEGPSTAGNGPSTASGIYSSPSAVAALAGLFEEASALPSLEAFLSRRGAAFYGLPPASGSLILERREWTLPEELDGAVPMLAGKTLRWAMARRD